MNVDLRTLDRICLGTVIVIFLVSGYWVVSHGARQLRELGQQNKLLSGSLKDLALTETKVRRLNAAISETRQQIKVLNERIPDSAEVGEFLKQLNTLMTQRAIVLESFKPLPIVEEKSFTRIPIRLICKGTFVNVYELLCDLETMSRFADVEKAVLTTIDGGAECRFDLTTNIFEQSRKQR
jgi:Tfp pilus assembly protein PilO